MKRIHTLLNDWTIPPRTGCCLRLSRRALRRCKGCPSPTSDRPSNGRAPVLRRFHDDVPAPPQSGLERRNGGTRGERERNGSFLSFLLRNYRGKEKNPPVCRWLFLHASQLLPRHVAAAPVSGGVVKSAIRESTIHVQPNMRTWTWD